MVCFNHNEKQERSDTMKKVHKIKKQVACPACGSVQGYAKRDGSRVCRYCGNTWLILTLKRRP